MMMDSSSQAALDATLANLSTRVQEVKISLTKFVKKLEEEPMAWPSALDSFFALSGQISTIMKQLKFDKTSSMQNYVFLPLHLSTMKDPDLEKTTDGRITFLHHEIVPDYLSTKLDLELEKTQKDRIDESTVLSPDSLKRMIMEHNHLVQNITEMLQKTKDSIDEQISKSEKADDSQAAETRRLFKAYIFGDGLPTVTPSRKQALLAKKAGLKYTASPAQHLYLPKAGVPLQ